MKIGQWTTDQIGETVTLTHRHEDGTEFMVCGRVLSFEHGISRPVLDADGEWSSKPVTRIRLELGDGDEPPHEISVMLPSDFGVPAE